MKEPREIIRAPIPVADIERPFEPVLPPTGRYSTYRDMHAGDSFQLKEYWDAIRKRLWLVIGIVVLMTTLVAIYMSRKPDIYSATAWVQVDMEQVNPDLVTSDRQRPMMASDPAYFNTQLQLLNSHGLLRRVVKDHNLDATKEFQTAKAEGGTSAFRAVLRSVGLATDPNKERDRTPITDEASLTSSEEVAEAVRLAPYVDIILRTLSIDPVREGRATFKDTRLIGVTFQHTSPEFAAYVANSIGEVFTVVNQEKRSGTNRKTNDFLQERIANLQADIRRDEEELVNRTQNAGILKTSEDQTIVIDRLAGLNKQKLEAEFARKEAEANYLTVKDSPDKIRSLAEAEMQRYTTERENTMQLFQSDTLKKVAELRQRRALMLQEYQEGTIEIAEIDAQITSLQKSIDGALGNFRTQLDTFRQRISRQLLENLRTKYLQAKDHEEKILVDFNKQFAEAEGQDVSAVGIKLLEQNIETNRGFLDNLRKQVSGNDVASQGSDNNISVREIAIPNETPVLPRRMATVFAALLLSILFGMGLALVLEYLDDTVRSTEEVERYLNLPALAAIPAIDSMPRRKLLLVGSNDAEDEAPLSPLLVASDPRSSLAEAYRHLRTSILLSTAGRAPRTLLITSSLPSEGKTTTATNTAISLAQTGGRVLIIDADLRRPRLHSIFNVGNGEGLSTLLSSELTDADIDDAIKQDEKSKLYLMTSGPIPPNPAELLGSEQMSTLLRMLMSKFTHVVLDSPPIASFTDGVLIASIVDGVILVVHSGRSSRQVVKRSSQMLQEIGAKIFGVVLNNVNLKAKDNYYYYQSYYHRDGYRQDAENE